ncbi:hypothetical protein BCV70DRAFT_121007 [Testicularia cyperi]|uniref:Uncharacterized protein n=1 Tax=Testicularia cyperi TaxID=1882483 RepID=A0A317XKT9_9BASI|nr:hypothetical protein BCV70DRAFT_121007 [Testicularia cyperi]
MRESIAFVRRGKASRGDYGQFGGKTDKEAMSSSLYNSDLPPTRQNVPSKSLGKPTAPPAQSYPEPAFVCFSLSLSLPSTCQCRQLLSCTYNFNAKISPSLKRQATSRKPVCRTIASPRHDA